MIKNFLIPFFIGGLVIAITTLFVDKMNPTIGAIFYAYPIVYVMSVIFMNKKDIGEFSKEAIPAGLAIALFLIIFPILYHYTNFGIYLSMLITTLIWIPITIGIFSIHWLTIKI